MRIPLLFYAYLTVAGAVGGFLFGYLLAFMVTRFHARFGNPSPFPPFAATPLRFGLWFAGMMSLAFPLTFLLISLLG